MTEDQLERDALEWLMSASRQFHRLLPGGVPVQYQKSGGARGDFVRPVDSKDQWPACFAWLEPPARRMAEVFPPLVKELS